MLQPLQGQENLNLDQVGAREEYAALKQRVRELKLEHRNAVALKEVSRKLEALALQRQQAVMEEREGDLRGQLSAVQLSLREATARAARMRAHHARELKAARADAVRALRDAEKQHAEALREADVARLESETLSDQLRQQLQATEQSLEEERRGWEAERQLLERAAAEWCQAQIVESRTHAVADVEAASSVVQLLQDRCQSAESHAAHMECQLAEGNKLLIESRREAAASLERADAAEQALLAEQGAAEAALQREMETWQAKVAKCEAEKAAELEAVASRFRQVIHKKDNAIADLKARLEGANRALGELQREQKELLELAAS